MSPYIFPGIKQLDINKIELAASKIFKIPKSELWERTRKREFVQARWFVIYYLEQRESKTEKDVIKITGVNRCTIKHSIKQVNNLFETDKLFKAQYQEFESNLKTY